MTTCAKNSFPIFVVNTIAMVTWKDHGLFGEVEAVVFVFCAGQDYCCDWCPHEDLLSNLDQLKELCAFVRWRISDSRAMGTAVWFLGFVSVQEI